VGRFDSGSSTPPRALAGAGRFEIIGRLGSGGMGEVFRAHDRERGGEVAIKVLRGGDPSALLRFKQEFRALVDVAHDNLVEYYELLGAGDQWLLAMEFVDGIDILSYVRRGFGEAADDRSGRGTGEHAALPPRGGEPGADDDYPGVSEAEQDEEEDTAVRAGMRTVSPALVLAHPAQFERLRAAMRQLAQGVLALHDAGHLHRDVKPTNVLVTRDERVVLLDFGVVTELARRDEPGQIVGTPAYMAPEQSAGEALSEKSDWYSVGVVLYEALTGRRPFGGSVRHSLEARSRFDPTSPRRLVPATPPDLDEVCMALLARRPEARPDGREVLRLLGVTPPPPRTAPPGEPDLLVGREAHIAALRRTFDDAVRGHSHTVLVRGSTGMGKTALVQRFLAEVREARSAVVLTGRCYERESMPYKALDPVIDSLCRHLLSLRRAELTATLPRDMGPLVRLFPVLRRVEVVAGKVSDPATSLPPLELRRRALMALRDLLGGMSARLPVIIHIDDLQWGDTDSAVVIQEMLRPPETPRLLFVAGFRSEDSRTSPFLRALLPLPSVPVEIEVAPLTRTESLHVARRLLGPVSDALPAVCNSIARESGGNPFFLHELVRYVRSGAVGDVSLGAISLEEVIRSRLDELPDDAHRLIEAVAVAGQPLSAAAARRATDLGDEFDGAVHVLRARKLVRARGGDERGAGAMEPYHDRIREVTVALIDGERRRAIHRALAVALSVETDPDPESLADHFEGAGDSTRAARLLIDAAEQASGALAFDRAAGLYQRALALRSFPAAEESALRAELARALGNAARGGEAASEYLEAAVAAAPLVAVEYQRLAAEHLLHTGHIDEGLDLIDQVTRAVGLRIPRSRVGAMLALLWNRARLRIGGYGYRRRDVTEIAPRVLRRLDACWSASIGLAMVDPVSGTAFQTRHLLLCLRAGEPFRLARALSVETGFLCTGGVKTRKRVERLLARVNEVSRGLEVPELPGWYHGVLGLAHYQWGEFAESLRHCELASDVLSTTTGLTFERTSIDLYATWSLYFLGDLGELARRVFLELRQAEERGDRYTVTNLSTGNCVMAWLARDDLGGARAACEHAVDDWSHRAYHLQHYWHFTGRLHADLYDGDPGRVWQTCEEGWPRYRRSLFTRIEILANEADSLIGRGLLVASGAGDREGRLRAAARLARRLRRRGPGYAITMGELLQAGVAARTGDLDAAGERLVEAEKAAASADMTLHGAAARWRRGQLIGGDEGEALVAGARATMEERGVARPERMIEVIAPGFE